MTTLYVIIMINEKDRIDHPIQAHDKSSDSYNLAHKKTKEYMEESKVKSFRIIGTY